MKIQSICSKCGGELQQKDDSTYKCKFCGAVFREDTVQKQKDALSAILDEEKLTKVASLKKALWSKLKEEYTDSAAIVKICHDIKLIFPDDFYANFYEAANSEVENDFIAQLENMDAIAHYDDIEEVLDYSLKSISLKNSLAICNLIERAFKQTDLTKYTEYRSKFDEQCAKLNNCVYDPAYPRDAFICYSGKDMPKVESLVKYLEAQGLLCFVAMRNLQHGRGAVSNYWKALHTAIENCKCIVFLSSVNSRDLRCDALEELRYAITVEQKLGHKIKKIEYLIDNYTGAPVERSFKKIFDGLEYCYDEETVFDRIVWEEPATPPEEEPELITQKEVKYCVACGKLNADNAKYCFNCGNDEFVSTQEDLIEYLTNKRVELEQSQKEAEEQAAQAAQAAAEAQAARAEQAKQAELAQEAARTAQAALEAQAASAALRAQTEYITEPRKARRQEYNPTYADGNVSRGNAGGNRHTVDSYLSGEMTFVDVDLPSEAARQVAKPTRNDAKADVYYSGADRFELIKGQNVLLPQTVKRVKVTIENTYSLEDVEADVFVFLLDGNERVLSESDLVFYGNKTSLNKSVEMKRRGKEVEIFFNKVNQDIAKIRFIMSFNMDDGKIRNFSMLNTSKATFYLEDQAYCFEMSNVGRFQSVVAFEFYRIRNKWKLSIQAAGLKEDIGSLCVNYGVDVE